MASLSSFVAFLFILFVTTNTTLSLSSSHDDHYTHQMNKPICNTTLTKSLQNVKNTTTLVIDLISKASPSFSPNGTLETLITQKTPTDALAFSAIDSCRHLFSLSTHELDKSIFSPEASTDDVQSWLCSALDHLETCIDGFEFSFPAARDFVSLKLTPIIEIIANSSESMYEIAGECFPEEKPAPAWLSPEDMVVIEAAVGGLRADLVVAKDGLGNYRTISDAMKVVPWGSKRRFFVYVKRGVYMENVRIGVNQSNVVMFGDGMKETIVSGNLNHGDGVDTFLTATFAVHGDGFIGRDIGFLNTAGPAKGQAVALVSTADRSVFYRCRADGYQDTLYVKSNRQFYRECLISGTIDFIFGNAAVVLQKCTVLARRPLAGQKNAIVAHGRSIGSCGTAITMQGSTIDQAEDLGGAHTYLGRPWKNYARTVFLGNYLGGLIDPQGWLAWDLYAPPPDTIFLAEYGNWGPGAVVGGRVRWRGVRISLSDTEALRYTVGGLINGNRWLPETNVTFYSGLWN